MSRPRTTSTIFVALNHVCRAPSCNAAPNASGSRVLTCAATATSQVAGSAWSSARSSFEPIEAVAAEAGRDPSALDYTRHGTIDMSESDVDDRARQGVTRLVVSPTAADPDERLGELEEFAQRHSLTSPELLDQRGFSD